MNYEAKKKELVDQFNQNNAQINQAQQTVQQLTQINQQIVGKVQLIDELNQKTPPIKESVKDIVKEKDGKVADKNKAS